MQILLGQVCVLSRLDLFDKRIYIIRMYNLYMHLLVDEKPRWIITEIFDDLWFCWLVGRLNCGSR